MEAAEYFKKLNGDYDKRQLEVIGFTANQMIEFADKFNSETLQELEKVKQELESIRQMQIISSENKQKDYTKYMK